MAHAQPDGFVAMPRSGPGSGVLVLHAWWGLNDATRRFCTQLADAGFVAFAPDLYHGKVTASVAEADVLSGALDGRQARADIAAATAFLGDHAGHATGRELAVIGFSLGAYFALELSIADPDQIGSVVVFYGTRAGDYGNSKADYLGHFADVDPFEPQSDVDALEASLRRAGRQVDFHHYPGTGHWFVEPDRPGAYDEAAARLAWERTLAFLRRPGLRQSRE